MKFTTAYYLMLLYVTIMIKPVLPIVSDWWQHEFNQAAHLTCVHSLYGNNHLQHEIAAAGPDNGQGKNQSTLKSEDQVPFHILATGYKNEPVSALLSDGFNDLKLSKLPFIITSAEGPPPRFA